MNTPPFYILDSNNQPENVDDFEFWKEWKHENFSLCKIAETTMGQYIVVTLFNGFYQKLKDSEVPLLFETYVLGGNSGGVQLTYQTQEEAEEGHVATVARIKNLVLTN